MCSSFSLVADLIITKYKRDQMKWNQKKKEKPDATFEGKKIVLSLRSKKSHQRANARKFLSALTICAHVGKEIFWCILQRSGCPTVAVCVLAEDFLIILFTQSLTRQMNILPSCSRNLFDLCPCKMYLWSGKMRFCPHTLKSDLKKRSQISSAWSCATFNLSNMCQLFVKHSGGFSWEKAPLMLYHYCYLIARHRGIPASCDPSKCLHAQLLCLILGRWSARPLGIVHACTLSTVWYAWGHINSFCSHLWFPVSLCPPHKSWPGGCRDQLPMWKLTGPSKKAMALLHTDTLISSAVPHRTASPSSALLG